MSKTPELSLRDELLSVAHGSTIKTYDFNGKTARFMVKDPTLNDVQWWRSEMMKANPDKFRKAGILALPVEAIPQIIVKAVFYPYDYGQVEPEKSQGAKPELAGKPMFFETDLAAIGESTLWFFRDMADFWFDRMNILYPFKKGEEAGN